MSKILELKNLKKYYATQKAVDDISFSIEKGSIFGLLGPNGAGKTTLLRMITGIFYPDQGEIILDGQPFDPINDIIKIGYMPEERGLYKKMKIGDQALYLAQLKGLSKTEAMEKIKFWFKRLEMESWWNKKVEDLSKGMSQKLQFVITVLHEPKLIILDEPFSGLDGTVTGIKQQFKENIYSIKVHQLPANLNSDTFHIVDQTANLLTVKINEGKNSNDVLKYFMEQNLTIESFNEVLPSLNDIFINLVDGTKAITRAFQPIND